MLLPQCDGLRQVAETAGFDLDVSAERTAATWAPNGNVEEAEVYDIYVYLYYIDRHRKLDCIMPWFPGDLYPELQQIVAQNKCRM